MRPLTVVAVGILSLQAGCSEAARSDAAPAAAERPVRAVVTPRAVTSSSVAQIDARVDSIEAYLEASSDQLKVYASVKDSARLVPVKDSTSWPDEVEASVNILRDGQGRMLLHREMPTSESGDWFEVKTHYFAPDGRTILYDYKINGFNECGILRERHRFYYDSAFALLRKDSAYTDKDDKPIDASKCYRRGDTPDPAKRRSADVPGGP